MRTQLGKLWVLLACLGWVGCTPDSTTEPAAETESFTAAVEKSFTGGPVQLILRLDKGELDLADALIIEQELIVPAGFESDFPEYLPEDFEGFTVTDIEAAPEAAGAGPSVSGDDSQGSTTRRRKRLTLEPDRSGNLAIAPLEVFFNEANADKEQSFWTEEITVTVRPLENVGDLDVTAALDIVEKDAEAVESNTGLWIGVTIAGAAGAFALIWFLFFRKTVTLAPPPPPPHEIAWENLRRLVALDLIAKGEIERFYVGLSGILRQYIEGRFDVHAPEQTTDEFFDAAKRAADIAPYLDTLRNYLDLCDRVKFARFEPDEASVQGSFDTLKKFIEETTPNAATA